MTEGSSWTYLEYVAECWRERLIPISRTAWEMCRPMTEQSMNAAWLNTRRAA